MERGITWGKQLNFSATMFFILDFNNSTWTEYIRAHIPRYLSSVLYLLCKTNCVNAFRHRLLLVLTMEEKLWNQGSREDGSAGQPTFGILTMNWLALLLSSTNPPPSCFWVEWLKSIMCNVLNTYQYNWYIVDVFWRWRYVWCAITYLCRRSIEGRVTPHL